MYQLITAKNETVNIINVARALIFGDTPMRTKLNTSIGRVVAPGPVTKLAITTSSREIVKDNNQADIIAGEMIGMVICTNDLN